MNIPLLCLFLAFNLIWLPRMVVAAAQAKMDGGYNNSTPRDQQAQLTGWGKRAHAAHNNSIEGFSFFAPAVLAALFSHASDTWTSTLCITYVVARTLYPLIYIADIAALRSTVWGVGVLATSGLYVISVFK